MENKLSGGKFRPGIVACISNHSIGKGETVRQEDDEFEASLGYVVL